MADALRTGTWRDLPGLSERQQALISVSEKLSREPTRMLEADWAPLRRLGFDDGALLEVAHIVGIFNHLTRLADGMGLELDAATYAASKSETPLGG